jgi:hypothetical protein
MISSIRSHFNKEFNDEKYQLFLSELNSYHPGDIEFRVAETPIYVDNTFTKKVIEACEGIVDVILRPDFKELTDASIPPELKLDNDGNHPECIAFDFGICLDENGDYVPQLIEMQGFPSLFAYQILHTAITKKHFPPPVGFDSYLNGYNEESYIKLLKEIIIGGHNPENVILLEVYPDQQKTRIDFRCTQDYVGIKTVCITELKADGKRLYYELNGTRIEIKRIYNRVIFDDLDKQQLPEGTIEIRGNWDVEWCPHPNWFYRVSKFTLPFISNPYVPTTYFLNEIDPIPQDLENFVLKPLFSFAGQGVIIDVTPADIAAINDPQNWILQKKVQYADAILTPDIPAKAEIRVFYLWPTGAKRPVAAQNLARLSKGKMIGVRYNADKEWVGGTLIFFEQ